MNSMIGCVFNSSLNSFYSPYGHVLLLIFQVRTENSDHSFRHSEHNSFGHDILHSDGVLTNETESGAIPAGLVTTSRCPDKYSKRVQGFSENVNIYFMYIFCDYDTFHHVR